MNQIAVALYSLCSDARQHGHQMIDIASLEDIIYRELIKDQREQKTSQQLQR